MADKDLGDAIDVVTDLVDQYCCVRVGVDVDRIVADMVKRAWTEEEAQEAIFLAGVCLWVRSDGDTLFITQNGKDAIR